MQTEGLHADYTVIWGISNDVFIYHLTARLVLMALIGRALCARQIPPTEDKSIDQTESIDRGGAGDGGAGGLAGWRPAGGQMGAPAALPLDWSATGG